MDPKTRVEKLLSEAYEAVHDAHEIVSTTEFESTGRQRLRDDLLLAQSRLYRALNQQREDIKKRGLDSRLHTV